MGVAPEGRMTINGGDAYAKSKTVYVEYRDRAGNVSEQTLDRIVYRQ